MMSSPSLTIPRCASRGSTHVNVRWPSCCACECDRYVRAPKRRALWRRRDGRGHGHEPLDSDDVLQIRHATPPCDDARWTDAWFSPWHRLHRLPGVVMAVDEFQAELDGLIMAQAEFETPAALPMPDFAAREVTDGPRFTGAYLVSSGLPKEL